MFFPLAHENLVMDVVEIILHVISKSKAVQVDNVVGFDSRRKVRLNLNRLYCAQRIYGTDGNNHMLQPVGIHRRVDTYRVHRCLGSDVRGCIGVLQAG